MIGSALKKLAKQNNMKVSQGVAYGSFHGFSATLSEGVGYKLIVVATKFPDPIKRFALEDEMNKHNLMKEFRVQDLTFMDDGVLINFYDNPGTMKKLNAFVDYFFPMLQETGALGAEYCCECGQSFMGNDTWQLVNGVALHVHDTCARRIEENAEREEEQMKEEVRGSYLTGFIGALLGGIVGAIVWAVVLYLGYFASIVGVLIGFLANLGYGWFKGKNGKGKLVILIIVALVSVCLGTFGADAIVLAGMISGGELPGYVFGDIPAMILLVLLEDAEYLTGTLTNMGIGLVFAFLGMWGVLRRTRKETASFKMKELE